jgi:hypothetical protein
MNQGVGLRIFLTSITSVRCLTSVLAPGHGSRQKKYTSSFKVKGSFHQYEDHGLGFLEQV